MKKFYRYILLFVCVVCVFSFTACNPDTALNSDYIADSEHCLVSLPQEYIVSFNNFETSAIFDKDLYNSKTVNGNAKKDGFSYYNVPKNEPFRIVTPESIIQDKNQSRQTLVYWKLNDTLYKDGDDYYSQNTFSCAKDTEITPVYYEFRAVGMIIFEADENGLPTVQDGEIFDDNGDIKEQNGVYCLYGVYDFEPYQNFWRTNLTVNKFTINRTVQTVAENYSKYFYTLYIEIEKENLFNKGKIIVVTLYKIDGHGYMTYGAGQAIQDNHSDVLHTLPIGEHTLKYSFN